MVRSAFTLIELIFAIVVIGISIISLPMMNQVTTKGIEGNIVQEAIFAAATELNQAVTANWDENSKIEDLDASARVIDDGLCNNDINSPRYRLKPGHISGKKHRRCLDSNTTTISNASANNNIDSLNDMSKTDAALGNEDTLATGYKQAYTTTVSISNGATTFGGTTSTNIKKITVSISNSNGLIASLKTYSCNIGEIDYHKQEYR